MNVLALIISPVGRVVAGCLVIIAALGGLYVKGYQDGKEHVQAKWDRAVTAAIEQGETARRDAERDIAPAAPSELCHDRNNRDKC